tara:strand:- start:649 stop:792 length:144 start_codon:yes stop_codon:yes gene_type:complete
MRKFTHIAFDVAIKVFIGALSTLAFTGIALMIYAIIFEGATANILIR